MPTYVILKNDCVDPSRDVVKGLGQLVRNKIGPIAVPEKFLLWGGSMITITGHRSKFFVNQQPSDVQHVVTLLCTFVISTLVASSLYSQHA